MSRVRRRAVNLTRSGLSTRKVARHMGYSQSVIVKWCKRAADDGRRVIPIPSSRPHHHPHELSREIVDAIIAYRRKYRRYAEVIHHLLMREGYALGLSSVKRTLRRNELTYPSTWKKWHQYPPRPVPERPGILVQVDTIHDGPHTRRLYTYILLEVCSRWAYARVAARISTHHSLRFVTKAQRVAPFPFATLQSDHGNEFSKWFTKRIVEHGVSHRHSRVRTPNDNAHLERFNRTIQDECIARIPRTLTAYQREIPAYLLLLQYRAAAHGARDEITAQCYQSDSKLLTVMRHIAEIGKVFIVRLFLRILSKMIKKISFPQ